MQMDHGFVDASPIRRAPTVVICKNSPSAETLLEAWRNDPHYPGIVTEYIASPCGIRTIARAVSSALRRHEESKKSQVEHPLDNQLGSFLELPYRPKDAHSADSSTDTPLGVGANEPEGPKEAPNLTVSRPPDRPNLMGMQSSSDSVLVQTQGKISPRQESSQGESGAEAVKPSSADGPILLLVDDNPINLQLLVTYAKKRKYPYLTAVNGQLAIDAYCEAYENSQSIGRPSIVLMG